VFIKITKIKFYYNIKNKDLNPENQYLTNYWPIENGQMTDLIGTAHMTQGEKTTFTSDRLGNANSALALNGGWTQVPPGIYFNSPEFTVTVWVYPQEVGASSRIFDFGNGAERDNVLFTLSQHTSLKPLFGIFPVDYVSNTQLTMNQWQFLAATYNGNILRIYRNGQIISETTKSISLPRINRTKCFIGRSNWAVDGYSRSILDELKFYNKGLADVEINRLYKKGIHK